MRLTFKERMKQLKSKQGSTVLSKKHLSKLASSEANEVIDKQSKSDSLLEKQVQGI